MGVEAWLLSEGAVEARAAQTVYADSNTYRVPLRAIAEIRALPAQVGYRTQPRNRP